MSEKKKEYPEIVGGGATALFISIISSMFNEKIAAAISFFVFIAWFIYWTIQRSQESIK